MKLHALLKTKKRVQRIGRSGKRGSYSGRGVKGQKSRSGRRLRPAERDLIQHLPKRRGFRNLQKFDRPAVFNVGDLSMKLKSFATGKGPLTLDLALLKAAHLVAKSFHGEVKVLGTGEMAFPVNVVKLRVSKSAKVKIVKAGGEVAGK